MTLREALEHVLREVGSPMHYTELLAEVMSRGLWSTRGRTPAMTVAYELSKDALRGPGRVFVRLGRGVYGLREWTATHAAPGDPRLSQSQQCHARDGTRAAEPPPPPVLAAENGPPRPLGGEPDDGFKTPAELPPAAYTPLQDVPFIWSHCPVRLRNSLFRARLRTIDDVLSMSQEEFASVRGVGALQVRLFRQLQAELRELVGKYPDGLPVATPPSQASLPPEEQGVAEADEIGAVDTGEPVALQLPSRFDSLGDLLRQVAEVILPRVSGHDVERNWGIWLRYHGLYDNQRWTLDRVGRLFGITRERVRQIVRRVSASLPWDRPPLSALATGLVEAFRQCLGVTTCDDFGRLLAQVMEWKEVPTAFQVRALLMSAGGDAEAEGHIVRHAGHCRGLWDAALREAEGLLETIGQAEHVLDFGYRLAQRLSRQCWGEGERNTDVIPCCGAASGSVQLPVEYVRAVLVSRNPCPLDGDQVWGCDWLRLRAARTRPDAVRAALRLIGRPAHYTKIAEFIREHSPRYKHLTDRSVHMVLVDGEEFELTEALGTYGLREWGVEHYQTVADRVEAFLRERGYPTLVREIVDALALEEVPENNIRACLNQRRFVLHSGGVVGLREWSNSRSRVQDLAAATTNIEQEVRGIDFFVADDEDDGLIIR